MGLIKICGLSAPDSIDAAIAAGADMVGFVFFAKSPRHIDLAAANKLGAAVRGRARKVALLVDADDAQIAAVVDALRPDLLQLHGGESPERTAAIKRTFGLPAMKAIAVSRRADLAAAEAYGGVADMILFDAKPPQGSDLPGGNGMAFDWSILDHYTAPAGSTWMLSGGLDAQNVGEAIARTKAPGVDVSSGVESAPGVKDAHKIAAFIQAARRAWR